MHEAATEFWLRAVALDFAFEGKSEVGLYLRTMAVMLRKRQVKYNQ